LIGGHLPFTAGHPAMINNLLLKGNAMKRRIFLPFLALCFSLPIGCNCVDKKEVCENKEQTLDPLFYELASYHNNVKEKELPSEVAEKIANLVIGRNEIDYLLSLSYKYPNDPAVLSDCTYILGDHVQIVKKFRTTKDMDMIKKCIEDNVNERGCWLFMLGIFGSSDADFEFLVRALERETEKHDWENCVAIVNAIGLLRNKKGVEYLIRRFESELPHLIFKYAILGALASSDDEMAVEFCMRHIANEEYFYHILSGIVARQNENMMAALNRCLEREDIDSHIRGCIKEFLKYNSNK